ncbi:D-alanyl-D-alanine carboxypeptidase family protein [Cytobacillus dafuensis]|uniref:D-alanyl-D-alanine carboxypeptidase n=1 Tax=Cytobacillus dafuensis TaxID=1742359 RepID=A0A5B8Z6R0_CYTDA|nr:D-alanyl-D-alanine carboxypeptidase family protein [Cytobacillus dafuensis]QED47863.1 D-alanyl-D-alanine carboxypeptidase [Cytobacillus dafuensis]
MKKIILCILILNLFTLTINEVHAEEVSIPEIKSEAAILMDSKTGAILYEKNARNKMFPASLTKIATAIYAIETGNLDDVVTVSKEAVSTDGTSVFLEEGEQVPLKKLIQGMLINSGNDAAMAIAEHLDGSLDRYEEQINQYLQEKVNVENTHFTNPHGLFDEDHYTTAEDLALITNYALKNETFRNIYGTKELKWTGQSWDTTLLTHHLMLKGEIPYEAVIGGKTGYVPESKFTLATTAKKDDLELTAIVLKGENDKDIYDDTKNLFDYGFNQFKHSLISKSDEFITKGKTFTTGLKDVMVTVPKSSYEKKITADGKLNFTNAEGEMVQSIQLVENNKMQTVSNHQLIKNDENKTMGIYGKFAFILIILGGLVIASKKIKR